MKVTTAEEMRGIDRRTIEEYAIPGIILMEAAGEAFARACVEELGGRAGGKRVAMVCGKGNNGGDGFVAARHLSNAGAQVQIFLSGSSDDFKGDAATFFGPIAKMGIPCKTATRGVDLTGFDLIGDALLGTGIHGSVTGVEAALIESMNRAGVPVVAADIPSGVEADTGRADGPAVYATCTVTFALPKMGLLQFPGAGYTGRLTVADIGIPRALLEDESLKAEITTQEWMRCALPKRVQGRDANKGQNGTVLVIAGSAGMAGAACLTALSALRAGAGLVYLAVPESLLNTAAALAPEAVLHGLPETSERTHGGPGAAEKVLHLAEKVDSVALGPGFGGNKEAASFVQTIVQRIFKPLVIDADGLNILSDTPDVLRQRAAHLPTVLTPHPGEMGRLLHLPTTAVQEDRRGAVEQCARDYDSVALLKGARTLIATPEGTLALNRQGSVALGTAGSGDVLTGVIGAMLTQKLNGFDAARAGAYLHALAGEIAENELGSAGVIAGDIRDRLPLARRRLDNDEILDEL